MSDHKPLEPHTAIDVSNEPIHWDLGNSQSYGDYLQLDKLLSAQQTNTFEHDEMMFIIIHQASELWMKLCIHELAAAIKFLQRDEVGPVLKGLARVARIQAQLSQSWEILASMTPMDYSAFRNSLGKASGFQSFQYRTLEFMIGNKNPSMIEVYRRDPERYAQLQRVLSEPSLYDETLQLLSRRGFGVPVERLDRDWQQPYEPHKGVAAAWLAVYHNREQHWELYQLAEHLVDFDHKFQQWRFNHMKTVERIIGYKRGTGGTSGVAYLTKALELRFFPELWSVRTSM